MVFPASIRVGLPRDYFGWFTCLTVANKKNNASVIFITDQFFRAHKSHAQVQAGGYTNSSIVFQSLDVSMTDIWHAKDPDLLLNAFWHIADFSSWSTWQQKLTTRRPANRFRDTTKRFLRFHDIASPKTRVTGMYSSSDWRFSIALRYSGASKCPRLVSY